MTTRSNNYNENKNLLAITDIVAPLSFAIGGLDVPALTLTAVRIKKNGGVMGYTSGNVITSDDAKVAQVQTNSNMDKHTATILNDTGKIIIFKLGNTDGVNCGTVNFDFLLQTGKRQYLQMELQN